MEVVHLGLPGLVEVMALNAGKKVKYPAHFLSSIHIPVQASESHCAA